MLESLSSLLESLIVADQKGTSQEGFANPLDDLIPSLRKIRKLAGIFFFFLSCCLFFYRLRKKELQLLAKA